MSYWLWLMRMAVLGLVGAAALGYTLRSQSESGLSTQAAAEVIALDPEYALPSDRARAAGYQPTIDALEAVPSSRLDSLRAYEDYVEDYNEQAGAGESAEAMTSGAGIVAPSSAQAAPPPQPDYQDAQPTPQPQPTFSFHQSIIRHQRLFESPTSLGMLAIGAAEGNYRVFAEGNKLFVQQTPLYFGHTDPGNLSWGQRVTNYGPCSDQGRSGGNIALAEQICSQRALERLPTNIADLHAAGIHPDYDLEALLNTADLYNQATPIHSRRFPEALAIARRGGLQGLEAIAWARTASFYLNDRGELDLQTGRNRASGLLGICAREGRPVTEWECVYHDQMRRTQEIATVLDLYAQVYNTNRTQP